MSSIGTKIVVTSVVREITGRTLDLHLCGGGGTAVWYGEAGTGKTTTARYLVELLKRQAASGDSSAFRAVHYHVGEISAGSGGSMKRALRSLYRAALGHTPDARVYRDSLPEDLANTLARELQENKIEMILIDGADVLSPAAIHGMRLVIDVAKDMGRRLTLVFIGSDLQTLSVVKVPPIFRRISEWCYFGEYELEETWGVLAAHHPHFRALDPRDKGHVSQVRFVREAVGGYPGPLARFTRLMDYYSEYCGGVIDERFLRAVYHMSQRNVERASKDLRKTTPRRR